AAGVILGFEQIALAGVGINASPKVLGPVSICERFEEDASCRIVLRQFSRAVRHSARDHSIIRETERVRSAGRISNDQTAVLKTVFNLKPVQDSRAGQAAIVVEAMFDA